MVDDLFSRCLPICLDVELYRTYIRYQQMTKKNQPGERAALCTAYEFTLEHVGIDFNFIANTGWIISTF
ncbi:hypothetical protein BVRB_033180 [Beta vulgaris subsp. vulgaris]|uniref:Suppressor of forked domain-containing protein n=1 Tax=Beta vulgaris subsp. vulgaris TaxID=3555 RepID=A0A0J8AWQ4_BETVV|nr:hypothetical protein BVRB_033180 [Beta vulgaris subsp. vulgaris]